MYSWKMEKNNSNEAHGPWLKSPMKTQSRSGGVVSHSGWWLGIGWSPFMLGLSEHNQTQFNSHLENDSARNTNTHDEIPLKLNLSEQLKRAPGSKRWTQATFSPQPPWTTASKITFSGGGHQKPKLNPSWASSPSPYYESSIKFHKFYT